MARKGSFAGSSLTRRARSAGGLTALSAAIGVTLVVLFGSSPAAGPEQGPLEIRVKDHREAIGDFSRLTLRLDKIAISPKPGLAFWKIGWRELPPVRQSIDLTKYTGRESVIVFKGMMSAGTFDGIQLKLGGIEGVLKKSQRQAQVKNTLTPIKLSFSVRSNSESIIVLDLVVLDMSDHPPRGYELAIKGYEIHSDGKRVDKVPPGE